jgi:hypothetical protein
MLDRKYSNNRELGCLRERESFQETVKGKRLTKINNIFISFWPFFVLIDAMQSMYSYFLLNTRSNNILYKKK